MVIEHVKDLISSNSKRISDPSALWPQCPVTPSDTSSKRISRWLFFSSRKNSRSKENSIYTWSGPLEFLLQQCLLILLHCLEQLDMMTTTVQPNQHHTKPSGLMDASGHYISIHGTMPWSHDEMSYDETWVLPTPSPLISVDVMQCNASSQLPSGITKKTKEHRPCIRGFLLSLRPLSRPTQTTITAPHRKRGRIRR